MAFIQKYIIFILLAVVAIGVTAFGVQTYRISLKDTTIAKQEGDLKLLNLTVDTYKKNAADNAIAVKEIQKIRTTMSKLDGRIANASPGKCMSKDDEKLFSDIFGVYNDGVREAVGPSPSK